MSQADSEEPTDAAATPTDLLALAFLLDHANIEPGACVGILGDTALLSQYTDAESSSWTSTTLRLLVQYLVGRGALSFICRTNPGASLQAMQIVAKEDVDLIIVEHYPGADGRASREHQQILEDLHQRADHVQFTGIGHGDSLATYQAHDWMLRHAHLSILVWNGNPHSDLQQCHDLARWLHAPVLLINPRSQTVTAIIR